MRRRRSRIVTYDWVPGFARGFVREIRVRWAAEEAGLDYRVETVPLRREVRRRTGRCSRSSRCRS